MIDVISDKKQMYDSVFTGKENASKDWNCNLSIFLTSFNVYFVCGYACIMCIGLKTAIWLFWDKIWLFWWTQFGNPAHGLPGSARVFDYDWRTRAFVALFCHHPRSHFAKLLTRALFIGPRHCSYIFVPCLAFRVHVARDLNKTILFLVGVLSTGSAEMFPGGNVDILLIIFRLLTTQCKWTFTKRFTFSTPQS